MYGLRGNPERLRNLFIGQAAEVMQQDYFSPLSREPFDGLSDSRRLTVAIRLRSRGRRVVDWGVVRLRASHSTRRPPADRTQPLSKPLAISQPGQPPARRRKRLLNCILREMPIGQAAARDPHGHRIVTFVQIAKTRDITAAGRLDQFCIRALQVGASRWQGTILPQFTQLVCRRTKNERPIIQDFCDFGAARSKRSLLSRFEAGFAVGPPAYFMPASMRRLFLLFCKACLSVLGPPRGSRRHHHRQP